MRNAKPAPLQSTPSAARLSTLDRLLPLWIVIAMALGLALGRLAPGLARVLDRVKVAGVSLPIALGLLWMLYPALAKVHYESLGRFRTAWKLFAASLVFIGIASGEALAGLVGPLIEVPVLVTLVYFSLWLRTRYFPESVQTLTAAGAAAGPQAKPDLLPSAAIERAQE